jgi:hypothetical protein
MFEYSQLTKPKGGDRLQASANLVCNGGARRPADPTEPIGKPLRLADPLPLTFADHLDRPLGLHQLRSQFERLDLTPCKALVITLGKIDR